MKQFNSSFLPNLSDEDKLLISRIDDWISRSQEKYVPCFSHFLDERQCELALTVLSGMKVPEKSYMLWGGYENASRRVLGVFPPYFNEERTDTFPIKAVTITYRKADELSHRDFLGSIMAQRVKRETVGDIITGKNGTGKSVVFIYSTVSDAVLESITKIGRVGVKLSEGYDKSVVPSVEFIEINGTVASLRLDAVFGLASKLSREKSASLIKGTGVDLNHINITNPAQPVKAGDVFSARGFGKFVFDSVGGASKKDRIHITIRKFV